MAGTLFVVSTPIGNLGDLSPRAIEALERSAVVACEDTRVTGRLLAHRGIEARLISLHDHNERRRAPELLRRLLAGEDLSLVSDAGTPLVSDPGYRLVREAIAAGVEVIAVPGPSAVLAALAVSGLPPYPFTFVGYPPRKEGRRTAFFERFADLDHTLVVFESPHRILHTLDTAARVLGERPAALARELTKLHEETLRGTLEALRAELAARDAVKGEMVLVIGAAA